MNAGERARYALNSMIKMILQRGRKPSHADWCRSYSQVFRQIRSQSSTQTGVKISIASLADEACKQQMSPICAMQDNLMMIADVRATNAH